MSTIKPLTVNGALCTNQHDLLVEILKLAGGKDCEGLRPSGSASKIADVYFERENWIFEVKSLETDRPATKSIHEQVGERLAKDSPKFGGPIVFGSRRIDITSLPEPMARNVMRIIGMNVQDAVKTANTQIKATRKLLNAPDAVGCIAVICPPHELDHDVIPWLVADAIRNGKNSAVQCVLAAHTPLLSPFGRRSGDSSIIFQGRDGVRPPSDMVEAIGRVWGDIHGQPIVWGLPPKSI